MMKTRGEKIRYLKDVAASKYNGRLEFLDQLPNDVLLTEIGIILIGIVVEQSISNDEHFKENLRNAFKDKQEIVDLITPRLCKLIQPFIFDEKVHQWISDVRKIIESVVQKHGIKNNLHYASYGGKLNLLRDLLITFKYRWSLNAREKQMLPGNDLEEDRNKNWKAWISKQRGEELFMLNFIMSIQNDQD